ncbi:MAG: hypothetical protein ACKOAR_04375, partial [Bacteroidota bacterium]
MKARVLHMLPLVLCCLLAGGPVQGQTGGSGDSSETRSQQNLRFQGFYRVSFDAEKRLLLVMLRDTWVSLPVDSIHNASLPSRLIKTTAVPGIGVFSFDHTPHLSGNELLFTTPGSGMVYQVQHDSIVRIDHSYDHRVQKGAIEFLRHDTIWRHGGYGAWSARTIITFFDKANGEWSVLRPVTGDQPPPGLWNHNFHLDGDSLWVFGGNTLRKNDPETGEPSTAVWQFNFNNR